MRLRKHQQGQAVVGSVGAVGGVVVVDFHCGAALHVHDSAQGLTAGAGLGRCLQQHFPFAGGRYLQAQVVVGPLVGGSHVVHVHGRNEDVFEVGVQYQGVLLGGAGGGAGPPYTATTLALVLPLSRNSCWAAPTFIGPHDTSLMGSAAGVSAGWGGGMVAVRAKASGAAASQRLARIFRFLLGFISAGVEGCCPVLAPGFGAWPDDSKGGPPAGLGAIRATP